MYIIKRIGLPVLFSLAGAIIMFLYGWASLQREFVQWKSLGKPPSNAIKVVALDYVQTASGDLYQYSYKQGCNGRCWFKSDATPLDMETWLPLSACGELPNLDKFVDSKAFCRDRDMWARSFTIEAIDNKGFVYSWDYTMGGEWDYAIPWLSSFIGAVAGLLIGLIILLVILFLDFFKWLKKRAQQKGVSEKA